MKKIVVTEPPIEDFYFTPHRYMGLGTSIVQKIALNKGFSVKKILFPLLKSRGKTLSLPSVLKYLKPYLHTDIKGPISFFKTWKRYGPDYSQAASMVLNENPSLVCISSFAFAYADCTLKLSKELRNQGYKGTILVGGSGPSSYPEYYLKDDTVDYVYQGEAESSFPLFLDAFMKNQPIPKINIWSTKDQKTIPPEKFLKPEEFSPCIQDYQKNNTLYITTSLTRGCKFNCEFCSQYLTFGRGFRVADLKKVFMLIDSTIKKYSIRNIYLNFEDDNILQVDDVIQKLLIPLKNKYPSLQFLAENGLDYRLIDKKILNQLIELGFCQFNLSLGTFGNKINRSLDLQKYNFIQERLAAENIPLITYFISGLNLDTPQSVLDSLIKLNDFNTQIGISLFYPVPGISGFENCEYFSKNPSFLNCGSTGWPHNKTLTTCELVTSFYLSRWLNLYKSQPEHILVKKAIEEKSLIGFSSENSNQLKAIPNLSSEMLTYFFENINL